MIAEGGIAAAGFDVTVDSQGVLWLSGELDMQATDAFAAAASALPETGGDVIVDLSKLEFIDSSGIRAILELGRQGRALFLRRPSPRVEKVLDLTGIIGRRGIALADD